MKVARFYIKGVHDKWGPLQLDQALWVNQKELTEQWLKGLRLKVGDRLVLFDDDKERLYQVDIIEPPASVHLKLVTEEERKLPARHIYLMWSLLSAADNEQVMKKATGLGVRNFIPLLTDKAVPVDFNMVTARKIIVRAAEQAGRADVPELRQPAKVDEILDEYASLQLLVCQADGRPYQNLGLKKIGLLVGPETGWSQREEALFTARQLPRLAYDLSAGRSETDIIAAVIRQLGD
jgi:16S rRNA (uracil1498-N3)-methyltransferase